MIDGLSRDEDGPAVAGPFYMDLCQFGEQAGEDGGAFVQHFHLYGQRRQEADDVATGAAGEQQQSLFGGFGADGRFRQRLKNARCCCRYTPPA